MTLSPVVHPEAEEELSDALATGSTVSTSDEVAAFRERLSAPLVNGSPALTVVPKASPSTGAVGLFVDIGTEAFFSNLSIDPVRHPLSP